MEPFNSTSSFTWDNNKCYAIAEKDHFPVIVKNNDIQKCIVKNFLNFYLGGKVPRGLTVCDVIFAVIAIMPKLRTETFIWSESEYLENGTLFYISPEVKLKKEINQILAKYFIKNQQRDDNECKNGGKNDPTDDSSVTKQEEDKISVSKITAENKELGKCLKKENSVVEYANFNVEENDHVLSESELLEYHKSEGDEESTSTQSKQPTLQLPESVNWDKPIRKREKIPISYGPKENAAFSYFCNQLLEQWQHCINARITIKTIFGYIALTLMRATVKKPKTLMNSFSYQRYIQSMRDITELAIPHFTIPHKKCLKKCHRVFNKKNYLISIMFAKIVCSSFNIDGLQINKVLTTTILTHTSDFGFGVINMLQSISQYYKCKETMNDILNATNFNETKDSWQNILKFMDKYMLESSTNYTYHWARIIDIDEFSSLSCSKNIILSIILGIFLTKLFINNNVDFWSSPWLKEVSKDQLSYYQNLGEQIYKKVTSSHHYKFECILSN